MCAKIWCSFGDSITYQETWQPYVKEKYSLQHINCGVGSTTVGVPASPIINRPSFYTDERIGLGEYQNTRTSVTADGISYNLLLPNSPDIVTIMGGSNDVFYAYALGDASALSKSISEKNLFSFMGAYAYIIETLLAYKPTIKIFLLSPVWSAPIKNKENVFSLEDCAIATKQIADFYAVPFIDVYHESGIRYSTRKLYCQSDFVHPNSEGGKRIAELVCKAFARNL